jgi:hypothetical protein
MSFLAPALPALPALCALGLLASPATRPPLRMAEPLDACVHMKVPDGSHTVGFLGCEERFLIFSDSSEDSLEEVAHRYLRFVTRMARKALPPRQRAGFTVAGMPVSRYAWKGERSLVSYVTERRDSAGNLFFYACSTSATAADTEAACKTLLEAAFATAPGLMADLGFEERLPLKLGGKSVAVPRGCEIHRQLWSEVHVSCAGGAAFLQWNRFLQKEAQQQALDAFLRRLSTGMGPPVRQPSCAVLGTPAVCHYFETSDEGMYLAATTVANTPILVSCGSKPGPQLPAVCRSVLSVR